MDAVPRSASQDTSFATAGRIVRSARGTETPRRHGAKARRGGLSMVAPQPGIGDWYRLSGGELFEVVAINEDDATIDIQHFDGTVEEMDREDWEAQWDDGLIEPAEPPEDWSGSVDVDGDDELPTGGEAPGEESTPRASPLDGLDLFE